MYESLPEFCSLCDKVGHALALCKRGGRCEQGKETVEPEAIPGVVTVEEEAAEVLEAAM